MPSDDALGRMYGPSYGDLEGPDDGVADPKDPQRLMEWLRRREVGTFVDFGCGSGSALVGASRAGWRAVGVEFDRGVAQRVAAETGCPVTRGLVGLEASPHVPADVIHLGDVIEHLTRPGDVLRALLPLLKPGGLLLAQGPLEAGPCLYTVMLRLGRWARKRPVTEMPPFHVLQATVDGQRSFFGRLGLEELEYSVSEVSWPAPDRLRLGDLKRPRRLGLYALRKVSQALSALRPSALGNRYFFAGRRSDGLKRAETPRERRAEAPLREGAG
jgi:SAM-dependent methyltransferase